MAHLGSSQTSSLAEEPAECLDPRTRTRTPREEEEGGGGGGVGTFKSFGS